MNINTFDNLFEKAVIFFCENIPDIQVSSKDLLPAIKSKAECELKKLFEEISAKEHSEAEVRQKMEEIIDWATDEIEVDHILSYDHY